MDSSFPTGLSVDDLNKVSVDSWSINAQFWDDYMGSEGNEFYQILEMPALERLLDLREGEHALDLATGNGLVARRMAALGGTVIGTDASNSMLEYARARTSAEEALRVTYRLLDVTKSTDFESLISHAHQMASTSVSVSELELNFETAWRLQCDHNEYGYHGRAYPRSPSSGVTPAFEG
jgi:SAM-dependent methyltransferase